MAILSTGFGNSMIVTVFVMGKEEMSCMIPISPLKKYYRRPDFGNVVAELYSNGDFDRNSEFTLRKSTSIFSVTRCQRITHYIERSMKRTQQKKTLSIIVHTWCSLSLRYNSNLKIVLSVKILHPAKNTSKPGPASKVGNYHIHGQKHVLQTKAPWFAVIQIHAFQSRKKRS